jgi:Type II secretory pathway, component PulD
MKFVVMILLSMSVSAFAAEKIKFNYVNEEIVKVLEVYSKNTKTKFVIDPSVRGKVTFLNPEPITTEEAFNQISSGLALNGFAISTQGDTLVVRSARNIQRDLIPVTTELPALKPERMATWIVTLKNVSVEQINRDLRILPSKDGEMSVNSATNQMIFSDYVSNLHRIDALLKELDKPVDPSVKKLVDTAAAERKERKDHRKRAEADGPKPKFPGQGPVNPPPPRPEEP